MLSNGGPKRGMRLAGTSYFVELNPNDGKISQRIRIDRNGPSFVDGAVEPFYRVFDTKEDRYLAHSELNEIEEGIMERLQLIADGLSLTKSYERKHLHDYGEKPVVVSDAPLNSRDFPTITDLESGVQHRLENLLLRNSRDAISIGPKASNDIYIPEDLASRIPEVEIRAIPNAGKVDYALRNVSSVPAHVKTAGLMRMPLVPGKEVEMSRDTKIELGNKIFWFV